MKYTYTCKKVPLNDSIKEYAEKRLEKLERYFHREDATAFVTFTVEKDKLCTVEITIRDGATLLRAQTTEPDGDMRGAIDAAVGYIERQILKNKTRLAKRLRSEGFPAVPADDFSVAEESEFHIVRTKRFSVKPMSPAGRFGVPLFCGRSVGRPHFFFSNGGILCILVKKEPR